MSLDTLVPGPGLTPLGHEQADALPTVFANERIEGIYVSELSRTHDTAAPLARAYGLDPVPLGGLNEIHAGGLQEGRTDLDSALVYRGATQAWLQGRLEARMPDAEDGHTFLARFDAAIDQIESRHALDSTIAIVSHGGAIRVWAGSRAANVSPEFAAANHLVNTGLVLLEGNRASGWIASRWNGSEVRV
jgi:broad specificity phosphatase PhoE